jgi:hypothetical protein
MSVRNSNGGVYRRTKLGMGLEQSAKEILAHVKGDRPHSNGRTTRLVSRVASLRSQLSIQRA